MLVTFTHHLQPYYYVMLWCFTNYFCYQKIFESLESLKFEKFGPFFRGDLFLCWPRSMLPSSLPSLFFFFFFPSFRPPTPPTWRPSPRQAPTAAAPTTRDKCLGRASGIPIRRSFRVRIRFRIRIRIRHRVGQHCSTNDERRKQDPRNYHRVSETWVGCVASCCLLPTTDKPHPWDSKVGTTAHHPLICPLVSACRDGSSTCFFGRANARCW